MGLAGTAYDGSIWVTAASSVGLVVASGGLVAGGAFLLARRAAQGGLQLGSGVQAPTSQTARRIQPLQKSSSSSEQQGVTPPPRAQSVDEAEVQ